MPKPTDHDERRRFVVSVATSLILAEGLEAVTQRNVAKAAGYSTAIVNHYFRNKQELLLLIYRSAAEAFRDRVEAIIARSRPALRDVLIGMLPLDEESRRQWQVFCAFLGSGVGNPVLSREQASRIRAAEERLAGLIAEECAGGLSARDADTHAGRLVNFINGLGVGIVIAPDQWPGQRAISFVDRELMTLEPQRAGAADR
jgi:AcrR family transcriptional regulator